MPDNKQNLYEPEGYPGYFISTNKTMDPKIFMFKTTEDVLSRAGTQGAKIGKIGSSVAGVTFMVDWNENDLGCVRVAKLIGASFPAKWIEALKKLGYVEPWSWEFWVNKTRLISVAPIQSKIIRMLTEIDLETSIVTTKIIP
jgi:hypothetical protein